MLPSLLRKQQWRILSFLPPFRSSSPRTISKWRSPISRGIKPPVAERKSFLRTAHDITWDDPYHWLSDMTNPAVLEYLEQENLFVDITMADTSQLQQQLKEEMASRLGGETTSPPERWGPWLYYTRVPEGKDYPVYYRRHVNVNNDSVSWGLKKRITTFLGCVKGETEEQALLDQNLIVEQFGYAQLGSCKLSQDHCLLAYTVDLSGNELFTLFVKNLDTGELLSKPRIEGVVSVEWAKDNCTLFYTTPDNKLRPSRVFRHKLGSGGENILMFEEENPSHYIDIARTKDWRYITINVNSKTSSEVHLIDAENPKAEMQLVEKRRAGVEYFVEHHHGKLFLLTNAPLDVGSAKYDTGNYRLVQCPVDNLSFYHWQEVVCEEHDVIIYDMEIFDKHLVLYQCQGGRPCIHVLDLGISSEWLGETKNGQLQTYNSWDLLLPQGVCSVAPGLNQDFYSSTLRLVISSPIMPEAVIDYNLATRGFTVRQQEENVKACFSTDHTSCFQADEDPVQEAKLRKDIGISSNVDIGVSAYDTNRRQGKVDPGMILEDLSDFYVCEHLEISSVGKVHVPLTLVYSRKHKRDSSNPALLMGYGAYGEVLDVGWCSDQFSLLDRGWVLAFAHVRGGGELGKFWHHSGKLLKKLNSMNDFLACAEFLIDNGYAHRSKLAARGMSAGGLLVAAAVNMRPTLFCAVVLKVPFVDICNTMLDESLPLTIPEYEEWGNPNDAQVFWYIRRYSPYDNVQKGACYPAMLVTSSFLDTRVGYWESAKWIACVREHADQNSNRPVLLRTCMDFGHFGEGGRYQHMNEMALEYAFLLKVTCN